jgi:hypothetical protein
MNDLGRRYFLFAGTARGKKIIVGVFIGVALALDLVGSVLASDGHHSREARTLFSFATGVILAGVVFILLNRRPR